MFLPKTHEPLHEAVNEVGKQMFDNWDGAELAPDIWETGWYPKRYEDKEVLIADLMAEKAIEEWGENWRDAAEHFIDNHPDKVFLGIQRKIEIEQLQEQFEDRSQANLWFILREASRFVYMQAKNKYQPHESPYIDMDLSSEPPILQTDKGPDPVELDEDALIYWDQQAEQAFAKRDQVRIGAQECFNSAFELFQQSLFAGHLVGEYITTDGSMKSVSSKVWATDEAREIFSKASYEGCLILVDKKMVGGFIKDQGGDITPTKNNSASKKLAKRGPQTAPKKEAAQKAIDDLWPNGEYEKFTSDQINDGVNEWLKKNNYQFDVSRDTTDRAISRRK